MMRLGWWSFGVVDGWNFGRFILGSWLRDEVRIEWFGCFGGECTAGIYTVNGHSYDRWLTGVRINSHSGTKV
jgi:hypothetical protein